MRSLGHLRALGAVPVRARTWRSSPAERRHLQNRCQHSGGYLLPQRLREDIFFWNHVCKPRLLLPWRGVGEGLGLSIVLNPSPNPLPNGGERPNALRPLCAATKSGARSSRFGLIRIVAALQLFHTRSVSTASWSGLIPF